MYNLPYNAIIFIPRRVAYFDKGITNVANRQITPHKSACFLRGVPYETVTMFYPFFGKVVRAKCCSRVSRELLGLLLLYIEIPCTSSTALLCSIAFIRRLAMLEFSRSDPLRVPSVADGGSYPTPRLEAAAAAA